MPADEFDPTAYEWDARPGDIDVTSPTDNGGIVIIRNSDRVLFRRCRRRWAWSSHLKGNLGPKEQASPLWFGSGVHYALEDFHGWKQYPTAVDAFLAYTEATQRKARGTLTLPVDIRDLIELGKGMLSYYENEWLVARDPLQTFWYNGIPQVEVNFRIKLPYDARKFGFAGVEYSGTIDRIIIDQWGQLWIVEYKTAKQIQTLHFAHDGQVSSYCWAGDYLYPGYTVAGVIYQQHRKDVPGDPPVLMNGNLSANKQILTTHRHYRAALINHYGDVRNAPSANVDLLNSLARMENEDWDKFIRRDKVERNQTQRQAEGAKILMELDDMLNPNLPLYPNPTRECTHMCVFNNACTSMDDGSDWQSELEMLMTPRDKEYDTWRKYLPESEKPHQPVLEAEALAPQLALEPPQE